MYISIHETDSCKEYTVYKNNYQQYFRKKSGYDKTKNPHY